MWWWTATSSPAPTTATSASSCGPCSTRPSSSPRSPPRAPSRSPSDPAPRDGAAECEGAPVLILDFDGVICDALTECALVTWLGIHQPPPGTRISAHAKAMPRNFVERFRAIRDYSRGLEHFMTAHRPMAANVRDQAHFDRLFGIFSAEYVGEFVASASAARARCREEEPEFWLDLHTLYPGIAGLLRRHDGRVCIVTAKDEESVRRILRRHGLEDTVLEVVGETTRKAAAVRALMDRHDADVAD